MIETSAIAEGQKIAETNTAPVQTLTTNVKLSPTNTSHTWMVAMGYGCGAMTRLRLKTSNSSRAESSPRRLVLRVAVTRQAGMAQVREEQM